MVRNLNTIRLLLCALVCAGTLLNPLITLAQESQITPTEMVTILRNAKIVNADYPLRASIFNKEVVVTTQRNPQAKDQDCKIDAILMAKTLMDSYKSEILRVKVLFSDFQTQKYTQINLSKGDIESYGDGKLSQADFLSSIEMTNFTEDVSPFSARDKGTGSSTGVSPGPLQDKRLLLLSRIESLKGKGTNVKAYMDYFQTIEDAVAANDEAKVKTLCASLSDKLNDQEKMRQQANVVAVQSEVLRFQTSLQQYILTGKKLPFDIGEVQRVQQLVVAGRNAEAKALLQQLQAKLH